MKKFLIKLILSILLISIFAILTGIIFPDNFIGGYYTGIFTLLFIELLDYFLWEGDKN